MNKFYVKCAVVALLVGISPAIYGQKVALNNAGNAGNAATVLDLSDPSNNKLGMLFTNVDITSVNGAGPIISPPVGLIVWNTNTPNVTTGGSGAGFYYWTGSQWVYIYNSGQVVTRVIRNQKVLQTGANFNIGDTGIIGGALDVAGLSTLTSVTSIGTANINGSGSALSAIGYGGTGQVEIGNNTGMTGINTATPQSTLDIYGSLGTSISTAAVSANTMLDSTYNTVLANPVFGSFTITLPMSGPANMRRYYTIIYAPPVATTNTVTIITANGPIYTGAIANNSIPLTAGSIELQSNGTNWYVTTAWGGQIKPGTPWIVTGDSTIVDGVNFIGTTNTAPINFGVNGNKAGRLDAIHNNTYVGYLSGNATTGATSGTNNTGMGYSSVSTATTASNDVGIGSGALKADNGGNNTGVGYNALTANTTGTNNTAVGYGSMQTSTIGGYNFAMGNRAMAGSSPNTGSRNIAVGDSSLYSNGTGVNSIGIGSRAENSNTSGADNIGIGYYAGYSNTSGSLNIGIGYKAVYGNSSGMNNVGIGGGVLYSNTSGSANNALGYYAMYGTTGATYNNALGYYAMYTNSSGSSNNAMGYYADYNNTSGSYNNDIGSYSGYSNTSGYMNNNMGYYADYSGSTGYINNNIGYNAGYFNTAGYNNNFGAYAGYYDESYYNTAVGTYAMYENYGGEFNSAMGYYAMAGLNIGHYGLYSNAVGYEAMYNDYDGYGNSGFGYQSMYSNYTGEYDAAIGAYSLYNNYSGNFNNALGYYASYSNTSGSYNNAIGTYALWASTTGSYNSAMGYYAMYNTTIGKSDVSVGYQAMYSNTGGSGNVAVGDSALYGNTGGGFNTAVGYKANVSSGTLTNATAIGNGATVGASNTMVMGNNAVTGHEFNGAVLPYYGAAYNAGTAGQVLTSQGPGVAPQWASASVANNGLTVTNGIAQLGGPLIKNTSITASASSYNLNIDEGTGFSAGTGQFTVTNGGAGNTYLAVINSGNAGNSVQVGAGTATPNADAALDVTSSIGGFLFPRLSTAQINAIASPVSGLVVYNTTTNCLQLYAGSWVSLSCGCTPLAAPGAIAGNQHLCAAGTATYTCGAVAGASHYVWSISPVVAGTQITSPTLTPSATATFAATQQTYTISVADDSGVLGCQSAYTTYTVNVSTTPAAPATPADAVSPILISTVQTFTIATTPGYVYTWSSSNTNIATITSGQGTGTISATFGATAGTTNICVFATNNGCVGPATCTTVTSSACQPSVVLDNSTSLATNSGATQTLTLSTTIAGEIILIAPDGYTGCANWTGAVTVDGNPTTLIAGNYAPDCALINMYYYVAAAAGSHTIVITEGNNTGYQLNLAVSLKSACGSPLTSANIGAYVQAYAASGTVTASVVTTIPNSYIFAVNCTNTCSLQVPTWGVISQIGADLYEACGINSAMAGANEATPNTYSVTSNDAGNNLAIMTLVVHP